MIEIYGVTTPFESAFPIKVGVEVQWPWMIEHDGYCWYNTGEEDHDKLGLPAAKYGRMNGDNKRVTIMLSVNNTISKGL